MPQHKTAPERHTRNRRRNAVLVVGISAAALAVVLVTAMVSGGDNSVSDAGQSRPAVTSGSWTTETYTGGPRLAVDRTEVDYGNVDYGQPLEAVYRLKNIGDEVVTIDEPSIKTLEGC